MKLGVIGAGYVGLVSAACFAKLNNNVICVDKDKNKIDIINQDSGLPIYEPGLEELIRETKQKNLLKFTDDIKTAVENAEVIFITVGTPAKNSGEADLSAVEKVSQEIAQYINSYKLIVEKSTVPVYTGEWVERTIKLHLRKKSVDIEFDVASNPEFLREGSAIYDFMQPDRIVIGVKTKKAEEILKKLYKPLQAPIIITDIKSAELIKHASNSFLAMKISFINALSIICDAVGGDIKSIADGIGLDKRIGREFLDAGVGFGGSCFPKDLSCFIKIAQKYGYDFQLLKAVQNINSFQRRYFVKKIEEALWNLKEKIIGILGLSFKPNTDDIRDAPSLEIIELLQAEGAKIKVYDPKAMEKAKFLLKDVEFCKNPYELAEDCDCLAVITDWDEFKNLDLKRIKELMYTPIIVDGRNIYDAEHLKKLGFIYKSIGRR